MTDQVKIALSTWRRPGEPLATRQGEGAPLAPRFPCAPSPSFHPSLALQYGGGPRNEGKISLVFAQNILPPFLRAGQMADDPCLVGVQPRTLTNYPCELADIPGRPARAKASILGTSCLNLCACLMQGAGERSLLRATLGPAK